jgi:hypothetical protein
MFPAFLHPFFRGKPNMGLPRENESKMETADERRLAQMKLKDEFGTGMMSQEWPGIF